MAETKMQQPRPSEQQQGVARRQEYYPARDYFFSPFSMMRRLSEEMDRAFSSTFGLWQGRGWEESGVWSPAVEVREQNNNLVITAELPGLGKEDVKVECTEEGVIIEGEKRQERETTEGGYHRSERTYGHFHRQIPLPEGAETDKAKAEFKNGVLEVRVPLSEQQRHKTRQIPINA